MIQSIPTNSGVAPGGAVGGASSLTTVGAIPYVTSAGVLGQDAGALFWDSTNDRLGVGTASPTTTLDLTGATPGLTISRTAISAFSIDNSGSAWRLSSNGNQALTLWAANSEAARFASTSANFIVASATDRGYRMQVAFNGVNGTAMFVDRTTTTGFTLVDVGWDGTTSSATTSRLRVRAGAVQGSTNLQEWTSNAGTVLASINGSGLVSATNLTVMDTAGAGSTLAVIQAGASQSGNLLSVRNNAGTEIMGVTSAGDVQVAASRYVFFTGRAVISSPAVGRILLTDSPGTDFNRLQFGGTTSSFPALKRSTTILQARLADDSANTQMQASRFISDQTTPSASTDAGTAGAIWADATYIYCQTASGTIKRVALSAF